MQAAAQNEFVDDREDALFGEGFLETLEYLHIVAHITRRYMMKPSRWPNRSLLRRMTLMCSCYRAARHCNLR